ncbi:MAG TPA: sigma-70 family RNA polymerase sigma factor [Nitrosopumilaceae archaeon]|jgi:RNA polymerase sigma factor (sigma-70 family)|nr:sigma-70 family RNA polymerase sigma factor [Nitrosopumilaceae archaeon]
MSQQFNDDNQLVHQYIKGNEEALAILVKRHKQKIYTYIYLVVRNRDLTEDIFQDTFFKVIQSLKAGNYYEDGKFRPWVMRIARNLIIDHFRRVKKMPTVPNIVNDDGEETDIFSILKIEQVDNYGIEKTEFRKKMRALVDALPVDQKEVLIMRMYYDMSFREISETAGIPLNTALGRMRYALINLRKMLEEKNMEMPVY